MDNAPMASVQISNIDKETWRRLEHALFPVSSEDEEVQLVFTEIVDLDTLLKVKGDSIEMFELKEGQTIELTASAKTKRQNAGSIQSGTAEWASSDPSVAEVIESDANELSAKVKGVGPGEAIITLKADANPGEGTRELTGVATIVVNTGDAFVFEFAGSTPVDEEEATTPPADEEPGTGDTGDTGTEPGAGDTGGTEPGDTGGTEPGAGDTGGTEPGAGDTGDTGDTGATDPETGEPNVPADTTTEPVEPAEPMEPEPAPADEPGAGDTGDAPVVDEGEAPRPGE